MIILRIRDGHNCGCSIIKDGKIFYNVEKERFSSIKNHDSRLTKQKFSYRSLEFCLKKTNKNIFYGGENV